MNRSQRHIHRWVWLSIIIILPLAIYFSLKDVSFNQYGHGDTVSIATNDQKLVYEEAGLTATVLESAEGNKLQLILGEPLKNASVLVYIPGSNGQKDRLLGQLKGVGTYVYNLNTRPEEIILYDAIKETEIKRLELKWD